jgi:hypothetical protein
MSNVAAILENLIASSQQARHDYDSANGFPYHT